MFRWLNGPGSVFRQPLPGSTNYLNAYDRTGRLLRAKNRSVGQVEEKNKKDENDENEDDEMEEDGEVVPKKPQRIKEARTKGS